jgi:hypothetical protein
VAVCLYVSVCHFCFTWLIFMKRDVNGLPLGGHQKCSTSKFCTTNIRKTQTCVSWERNRNCVNAPRGSLFDGDDSRVIGATYVNFGTEMYLKTTYTLCAKYRLWVSNWRCGGDTKVWSWDLFAKNYNPSRVRMMDFCARVYAVCFMPSCRRSLQYLHMLAADWFL